VPAKPQFVVVLPLRDTIGRSPTRSRGSRAALCSWPTVRCLAPRQTGCSVIRLSAVDASAGSLAKARSSRSSSSGRSFALK
jgi:hypothetical protein